MNNIVNFELRRSQINQLPTEQEKLKILLASLRSATQKAQTSISKFKAATEPLLGALDVLEKTCRSYRDDLNRNGMNADK